MKVLQEYFHCGDFLKQTLSDTISEVDSVISSIMWTPYFIFKGNDEEPQAWYNKAFEWAKSR